MLGSDGGQLGAGALAGSGAAHPVAAGAEGDVLEDAHVGEDAGGLGEEGDVAAAGGDEGAGAAVVDGALADSDGAVRGVEEAGDDEAGRGLARAVGADEGERAPGGDVEVESDVALG